MFCTFPEGARWSAEQQAVEFAVVIGEYQGVGPEGLQWLSDSGDAAARRACPAAEPKKLQRKTPS
jgi:hypothetical protein